MITIDLCPDHHHGKRASSTEEGERFEAGVELARIVPAVRVCVPVGPAREDRVELDGELLSKDGAGVF